MTAAGKPGKYTGFSTYLVLVLASTIGAQKDRYFYLWRLARSMHYTLTDGRNRVIPPSIDFPVPAIYWYFYLWCLARIVHIIEYIVNYLEV